MRSWWNGEQMLAGQDAQWVTLRRALDPDAAADRIRQRSEALLEQSQIWRERGASLRAAAAMLQERVRAQRRLFPRRRG